MTFKNSVKSISFVAWCLILVGDIPNFFSINFWVSSISSIILIAGYLLGLLALALSFIILFTKKRSAELLFIFVLNLMCILVLTYQILISLPHPT